MVLKWKKSIGLLSCRNGSSSDEAGLREGEECKLWWWCGGSDGQLSPQALPLGGGSPMAVLRHSRSGSVLKRSQNTKAAAQRLAQMMTNQQTSDSEDEDEYLSDYNPSSPTSSSSSTATATATATTTGRSQIRPRSPMVCLHAN
ncbi:hypothetical protein OSB04_000812 [Centaurea solstitialis]|uniref:Uncharacterized protein n=1 Tax=Centaurea solstitialis TaxID=347529 RepID=A0AA38WUP9_9ASTR|nr:hypothetical protein OSB04_000812 [Centaurea solstitialis]